MAFKKITDADLQGKGNVGKPDTPGYSTAEMQRVMDEIPREVIVPAFNALVNDLNGGDAAGSSGAQVPATLPDGTASTVQGVLDALAKQADDHIKSKENPHDVSAKQVTAEIPEDLADGTASQVQAILNALAAYIRDHKQDKENPHDVTASQVRAKLPPGLPEDTDKTMQAVVNAVMQFAESHTERVDNPHNVTASQVGAYTKKQTDNAIDQKITEIGSGDMAQAVYDPEHKKLPIYGYVEDAAGNLQNQCNELNDRMSRMEYMTLHNDFSAPIAVDDSAILADDAGNAILADWKYKEI